MTFFEIEVHEKDQQGQIRSLNMRVNPKQVLTIIRQPLQPAAVSLLGANLVTQTLIPDEIEGLVKMETFEGGTAHVNPDQLLFYFTTEIGKYLMLFPGGTQVAVKETGERMKQLFEGAPSIQL